MSLAELTSHPFQPFDLSTNRDWQGIQINTADDAFFEERTRVLEAAFEQALDKGGLLRFVQTYIEVSRDLIQRSQDRLLIRGLLEDVLFRLVNYYIFVRRRTRPYLAEKGSAYTWQLGPRLIAKAQAAAAL